MTSAEPTPPRAGARADMPEPLRRDVRLLGELLGQVVREGDGEAAYADVERLRRAVLAARDGGDPEEPARVVAGFDVEEAERVARAFTVYFHLVNLAEERQRIRVLRERDGADRPDDSLAAAAAALPAGELPGLLDRLEVRPVLTAHPTEARRRAVVTALRRVGAELDRHDDPRAGAGERADARRRLLEEVTLLWRTAPLRRSRPGPLDEVRAAMAIFDETLFRVVPTVYRRLDDALLGPAAGARPPVVPAFLRWGSWIGGDRDGNPNVTAAVTRDALAVQNDHVLRALETAATRIGRALTLDAAAAPPSAALLGRLDDAATAFPALLDELTTTSPGEPHRAFLLLVAARLAATRRRDVDLGYRGADELLADLRLLQVSLAATTPRAAYGELAHLVWQAQTFGFHLAELEVRQHSGVHERVVAGLLGEVPDAATLDRLAFDGWPAGVEPADDEAGEALATFRVMAAGQARYGVAACRRYVVSFTRRAADLVAVRALARLAVGDRPLALDVVPLFETRADLARAVPVLEEWLALPGEAAALQAGGRRLVVMLGYSDSAKDVGPASATLALYDTQATLVDWARRHDVALTIFHGRGGALGRGGGPANRAVLAQAPGSVAGRFTVTEQGEVIFARYGQPAIARRHLDQVTAAVLLASTPAADARTGGAAERFADTADRLDAAAAAAYRELVDTGGFAEFFARVSPLEEIGGLRLGSRPARRPGGSDLGALRAIPWVFAWSQTRCNLPGWYGLGTGLAAVMDGPGGLAELRAAYAEWPLFAALLENAEMSLAKTDRGIAARYLALGDRPELTERILAELDRTTALVLEVTGHPHLLADRPVLSWAVALRNPYVDALSHLQLRALAALRGVAPAPADADRLRTLVLLTVNGVAAGLQNTG